MADLTRYLVWDFWTDKLGCYAVVKKEEKLYFSEVKKDTIKLL